MLESARRYDELNRDSLVAIREGSKSFALASSFFGAKERDACHLLYLWCRYCDDVIDRAGSTEQAREAFVHLETELARVTRGEEPESNAFRAFKRVHDEYGIPTTYALDLLQGFKSDANGVRIETEHDLVLYCYRVAGVVGLMMCHIMGLDDREARQNAVDMGIAMQMTNIARDVLEDFRNGRIYLPRTWLLDAGVRSVSIFATPQSLCEVVHRLLGMADKRYVSGRRGLKALPLRAAIAVSIAASVYAGIGEKILRRGPRALRSRTILGRFDKFRFALRGLVRVAPLVVKRALIPWRPLPLEDSWQFTIHRS